MSYFYNVIENVDVATFDDAVDGSMVNSAVFSINPIQDLHGQAYPYSAGAGPQRWNEEWELGYYSTADGSAKETTLSIRSKSTSPISVEPNTSYYAVTPQALDVYYYDNTDAFISYEHLNAAGSFTTPATCNKVRIGMAQAYGTTYEDNIAINYPATVTIYAPYSNICPITGWTGANISRAGKNLFDKTAVTSSSWLSTTTGLVEAASESYSVSDYIPVASGKPIYILNSGSSRQWFYDKFKNPKTYLNGVTIYTPTEDGYIRVTINTGTAPLDTYQIEYGSTATAYEAYKGDTYAIDWTDEAGTVYGGYVDITNGTLVITHANIASYDDEEINGPWISSMDAYSPGAMPTTGAQVVYPINPPIETSIPAFPIEVLDGVNNIWSDNLLVKKLTYRIDNETFYRRYDYIMNNPGYYLFDGGGIDLSSASSQSITGSWNRTVTAIKTNKPIFAYNTKYGSGKPLTPVPVFCWYITTTQAVIVGATLHIIVNSDDSCIVQDVATANRSLGAIEKAAAEIPAVEETAIEEETSLEEETSNNE